MSFVRSLLSRPIFIRVAFCCRTTLGLRFVVLLIKRIIACDVMVKVRQTEYSS